MKKGAIVLCGGKSTRMGRDKATLPFGPEPMLQRVVRRIGEAVALENVVVVGAAKQSLPPLPASVLVVRDAHEDRGPLEGLAAGLRAQAARVDAVYATACDVPLLVPALIGRMFELLGEFDIAVPFDGQYHHPLAAVYRPTVLPLVEELLDSGLLRPQFLFPRARTRVVPVEELRAVDPHLATLKNLNHPGDYLAALRWAGLAATADDFPQSNVKSEP